MDCDRLLLLSSLHFSSPSSACKPGGWSPKVEILLVHPKVEILLVHPEVEILLVHPEVESDHPRGVKYRPPEGVKYRSPGGEIQVTRRWNTGHPEVQYRSPGDEIQVSIETNFKLNHRSHSVFPKLLWSPILVCYQSVTVRMVKTRSLATKV